MMASTEGSVPDGPYVAAPLAGAAEASTTTTINQGKGMSEVKKRRMMPCKKSSLMRGRGNRGQFYNG